MIKIYGKVTDFDGNPIEGATVEIKNKRFETVYQTISDAKGNYRLEVKKGTYIAMYACKDYGTKNLEYWTWDVLAYQDLEVNPRIDGLEVYAIKAWIPQGAMPSMQIYFRPMSLRRAKDLSQRLGVGFPASKDELKSLKVIDIAPKLTKDDVDVTIDKQLVKVLELSVVREAVGEDQSIYGYVIQTSLPEQQTSVDYNRICVVLRDPETGEKGEGLLFWKKLCYA